MHLSLSTNVTINVFLVNMRRNTYLLLGENRLQYCLYFSPRVLELERETAFGILYAQSRVKPTLRTK